MSSNDQKEVVGGTYWELKSERRRPRRTEPTKPPSVSTSHTLQTNGTTSPEHNSVEIAAPSPFEERMASQSVASLPVPPHQDSMGSIPPSDDFIELYSQENVDIPSVEVMEVDNSPEKAQKPVTRRMALEKGEDVWKWTKKLNELPCNQGDEAFVAPETEEVVQVQESGLELPMSWNHLDPTRDKFKKAQKSDMELLREMRKQKPVRSTEPPTEIVENGTLPIFEAPEEFLTQPRRQHTSSDHYRPTPQPSNPHEALEPKKRQRSWESAPDDFLPSYGPDFIVDDGSGYTVDPDYSKPVHHEVETRLKPASLRAPQSSVASIAPRSSSPTSRSEPLVINPDADNDYNYADNMLGRTPNPLRARSPALPSNAMQAFEDLDASTRTDEMVTWSLERSNAASVASHSTTALSVPMTSTSTLPIINDQQGMLAMLSKLRLTVRVKDEPFFISCPPESTFAWLQQEAINRYRQLTRMEVELDHLETTFGSRLMPNDKIREYMNDLETVVCLIKEAKPLDLVSLYRSDCESNKMLEVPDVIERLANASSHDTSVQILDMSNLALSHHSLCTLRGVLNLHQFMSINFSGNQFTSLSFSEIIAEICKSNSCESLAIFSISNNLLGLSLELDPIRSLFGKLTGLSSFNISYNMLNDRAVSSLLPLLLTNCKALTDLSLEANFFGIDALKGIQSSNLSLSGLTKLNVARNPLHAGGFSILIKLLSDLPSQLEELDLSYTHVFTSMDTGRTANVAMLDDSVESLSKKLPKLTRLSLRGCGLDSQENAFLLPSLCISLKRLTHVDMSDCGLIYEDLRFLKGLSQSPTIVSLNLSLNRFSSSMILSKSSSILELIQASSPSLTLLNLSDCEIGRSELSLVQQGWIPASRPNLQLELSGNGDM